MTDELPDRVTNLGEALIDAARSFTAESQDYFETSHLHGHTVLGIASEDIAVVSIKGEGARKLLQVIHVTLQSLLEHQE